MSRIGTARAATVSKQLRRKGFIVGRTGVNEHLADVMVRSNGDKVRVMCRTQPDADPKLVADNTQEITRELVNKGYDVTVRRVDDPEMPITFLYLSRPKWDGQEEIANRLGDINHDSEPEPQPAAAETVGPGHPDAVHGLTKGRASGDPSWCGLNLSTNAGLRFSFDPDEVTCSRCRTHRPRELSVPAKVERAIAKRNQAARPTAVADRDSNLVKRGGLAFEEIIHDPAAYEAVLTSGGKLRRCQCGGPDCTATTRRSFAPGHDAAMVSRWAARVAEGAATMDDATRNILGAGGSDAMVGKVRAAVARKQAQQDTPADRMIRVRVNLTIEVTPEGANALNLEYGCGNSDAEIRAFARSYILEDAQQSPAGDFWSAQLSK